MSSTSLLSEEATVNNNQNLKISRGKYKKGSMLYGSSLFKMNHLPTTLAKEKMVVFKKIGVNKIKNMEH
jgi:hypothetical protein